MFTYTLKCVSIYIDSRGVYMNNKGFTLIELLAVIIILIGISSVSIFNISASLKRNEEQECDREKEIIQNAAKIYFSLQNADSMESTVPVNKLLTNNYLKEEDAKLLKNASVRNNSGEMVINGSCTS